MIITTKLSNHSQYWFVLFFCLSVLSGCALIDAYTDAKYETLSVEELNDMILQGQKFTLVDARKKEDFDESHIAGAINVPIGEFDETFESIPKDKPVAIICYLGLFSRVGAQTLVKNGYEQVFSVSGGMSSWRDAFTSN